jgi:tetratricopeptide (TPR) repeat protein
MTPDPTPAQPAEPHAQPPVQPPTLTPAAGTRSPRARRSPGLRAKLLLIVFGFVLIGALLGLTELGLRLAGLGGYPSLVQKAGPVAGGTLCVIDTPGPASYFFNNPDRPGSINASAFVSPKPKGTFRVFTAGESAMQGYPQPKGFASSEFLQAMLQDVWPERRVEVINIGVTAVASFPVLEMATEALDYEPDLMVAYVGNNEYFGAYGVASLNRAARSPQAIRLQRWFNSLAIVQGVRKLARSAQSREGQTLMETMMGQSFTAPDDPLRDAADENLRTHLSLLAERCQARGVPLVICTLPANERGMAPLGQSDISALSAADRAALEQLLKDLPSEAEAQPAAMLPKLDAMLAKVSRHATLHFWRGRALLAQGDRASAIAAFEAALTNDPMPWRGTPRSNQTIASVAQAAGAQTALADLRGAFREASPGGAIGWELMDDHVHPTIEGQFLAARAMVKAMTNLQGPARVEPAAFEKLGAFTDFAQRLGDNPYDRYGVQHTMRVLAGVSFFKATNPDMLARFEGPCRTFEAGAPKEVLAVMREWQDSKTHIGGKRPLSGMAARAFLRLNRFADAGPLFFAAARNVAAYSAWNLEFEYFYLVCRERAQGRLLPEDLARAGEAIERGKVLMSRGRSTTGQVERFMARLHQLRGEWAEAVPLLNIAREKLTSTDLVSADQALVQSLVRLNRIDEAKKIIAQGVKNAGQFAPMYKSMESMIPKGR